MKGCIRSLAALAPLAIILACPAHAAGWSVEKNEEDPFDTSKSTFIAATLNSNGMLAIRCLQGTISLLVGSGPSNASAGDTINLEVVADRKGVREEDAEVLTATNFTTGVQFGDASTLDYLEGTQDIDLEHPGWGDLYCVIYRRKVPKWGHHQSPQSLRATAPRTSEGIAVQRATQGDGVERGN